MVNEGVGEKGCGSESGSWWGEGGVVGHGEGRSTGTGEMRGGRRSAWGGGGMGLQSM